MTFGNDLRPAWTTRDSLRPHQTECGSHGFAQIGESLIALTGHRDEHNAQPHGGIVVKKRRNQLLALAVLAVVALVAAGVVLATSRNSDEIPIIVEGSFEVGDLEAAPELSGTDPITGETVSLSDFAGIPVVINIWADWCPGCRAEAPALKELGQAFPNVQLLGIDFQDTISGARNFYDEFDLTHPSIFDESGSLGAKLGLIGMPTTIFLNDQHQIVTRIVGETDLEGFTQGVEAALAASSSHAQ